GEGGVEPSRIGLLVPELAEQPDRPAQRRAAGPATGGGAAQHAATLPDHRGRVSVVDVDTTEGLEGRHVAFFSWRDTRNPEGGGAERYLEKMAAGLVARGCRVTIFCVAHDQAPRDETVDGIRFVRRGTKLSIYLL